MDRIERVSNILNDTKAYDLIGKTLGIEIDVNSEIFRDIEEYIIERFEDMDDSREPAKCRACNELVDESSIFCSYECSKIDAE
tara:strand:+ start:458 stop:706 length:249 start_codon:yes stop_codon:yes gene_type:complete